ncbi:MAG: caspase family protein [Thermodesulfobacteriota bacterium]|nr:caspase family protein [Thermodesulfobacteriota bacterium]
MKLKTLYLVCVVMMFSAQAFTLPAIAEDSKCALAKKIEEKAALKFKKDKKEGLKLFIKAHGLCPDDAGHNFNLGLAFFRYGNLKEAKEYLKKAVSKDGSNGDWLNLLAWVMLETGSDREKALEYAEKAVGLKSNSPAVFDTLIRAYMENGKLYNAILTANKAKDKWPKNDRLAERYDAAVDDYIAWYLKKAKEGKPDEALAGLKKIDFDPDASNAYCWMLFAASRTESALSEAQRAKGKFRGSKALENTFDQIMDRFIQACYQKFKDGKRSDAVMAADKMKRRYAAHKGLNDAYDRMFAAILDEADTISVPKPMKIASRSKGAGGRSAVFLAGLQGGEAIKGAEDDLQVDVDKNIPEGKTKNPHSIAVIIGNKNYARFGHGIPDVNYAKRDAAYMKKYVINLLGYDDENVICKFDATQGQMSRIFGTRGNFKGEIYNYVKPGKSDVFIYYVGHGAPDPKGKGAFLMPVDASADYISANGYPLDTFYNNLEKIPARSITIVLDACFSGNSAGGMLVKNISPGMLKSASPVRKLNNGVIFSSTGKDQVSHWYPKKRHSLFTYFFMKGLKGDADENENKTITVAEMKEYLQDKVPYRARRLTGREQTPVVVGDGSCEIVRLK